VDRLIVNQISKPKPYEPVLPYDRGVKRTGLAAAAVVLVLAACSRPATTAFAADRALAHVAYLADPARGGRLSGSPQLLESATYVADRFREIGLEPLGDNGTFLEHFQMPLVRMNALPTLARISPSPKTYRSRIDFSEYVSGRAGAGDAEGAITVVGPGDRADFTGVNLQGRIALLTGTPNGNPIELAYQQHATAALIVVAHPEIRSSYLPFLEAVTIPALHISEAVADELIGQSVRNVRGDVDARVRIAVPLGPVQQVDSVNVVGLLRGSDSATAARAVLVGGHLDGLGTDPDGTVFPGANDNASGVAITIEVARALAADRAVLRQSIVFVAFSGEEEGYLGSSAYVQLMSAVPGRAQSIVAFLNVDASGCCGDALGASAESADLQARIRAAVERLGIKTTVPTGGSDHQVFSRARVPAVLVQWTDPILHTPADGATVVDLRHLKGTGDVVTIVARELASSQ
jgi:Peptidase family M28